MSTEISRKIGATVDFTVADDEDSSSLSMNLSDGSIRHQIKFSMPQVLKPADNSDVGDDANEKKWWLKRSQKRVGASSSDARASQEAASSMREFLEKEKMCKASKDDTLCDILASAAFDKYPSDFENATDEDIGSFLEEMSKIAGALSPNSAPERTKSGNSSKNPTEEEKSVEELLEEAEKLVRENSLSKSTSKSDTLIPDNSQLQIINFNEAQQLEDNIFHLIEQEVHKETEKIRKSPKNEKKNAIGMNKDLTFENINSLKPPTTVELQKKRFEDHKDEISSSSDMDDPIERHSQCDDVKTVKKSLEDKQNLRKEITDVEKDFFNIEGKISGSTSFGHEDFSHFLKILQNKSEAKLGTAADPISTQPDAFPEKEITEILERELEKVQSMKNTYEPSASKELPLKSTIQMKNLETTKSENELYDIGLTPRLELFADVIPKLIVEKSSGKTDLIEPEPAKNTDLHDGKDKSREEKKSVGISKTSRPLKPPSRKAPEKSGALGSSRSYDQLPKPTTSFQPSSSNLRSARSSETLKKPQQLLPKNPLPKSKNIAKPSALSSHGSKIKFSVKPTGQKSFLPAKTVSSRSQIGGGDNRANLSKDDWEVLCYEERHKNALLKNQIEAESKLYKQQIESMRTSYEEELFSIKKQNIILTSKIDELSLNAKREQRTTIVGSKAETRVALLEKELTKQEHLIQSYEADNKRLMQETKRQQEELKNMEQGKHSRVVSVNETQKLNDTIKDLREEILKLNFELTDLRQKNSDMAINYDDVLQRNSLLEEELSMFKEQLKTKDRFITDKLHQLNQEEIETKRKLDEMRIELNSKSEKLTKTVAEFDQFQQAVIPLEKELLELRVKEENMQEKLQIARSHVEREKVLTQKLKDQVILDNKKILDLNRQVREMERILKRKNPDSVSALILTAKSDHERYNLEKVKLLEDRLASLEGEIAAKEQISQEKLTELQGKFGEMKAKYTSQVAELEEKLREATRRDRRILSDRFTQTTAPNMENKCVETRREEKSIVIDKIRDVKIPSKPQTTKEDAHLIATIRGLKMELMNKDKAQNKLTKEFQELQKTNRRLQKEREKLLNDRKNFKPSPGCGASDLKLSGIKATDANDQNSNIYQNGHYSNGQKLSGSSQRLYDPLQYSENSDSTAVKRLTDENEILKEELNKMTKDFMTLKNKRLYDLNLLQEEHEREIAALVKDYSMKFGDSKVVKLQGQLNTQVAVIAHLKQQIEKLRDYREQVIVLKVERENLETKVKMLNEKVKYLSTPGTEQLQLLQEKITVLQQRHESREITLQNLVRDLLRNRTQCYDCKGEKGKSRQLCYFRQELDHILAMLQEIANVQ